MSLTVTYSISHLLCELFKFSCVLSNLCLLGASAWWKPGPVYSQVPRKYSFGASSEEDWIHMGAHDRCPIRSTWWLAHMDPSSIVSLPNNSSINYTLQPNITTIPQKRVHLYIPYKKARVGVIIYWLIPVFLGDVYSSPITVTTPSWFAARFNTRLWS